MFDYRTIPEVQKIITKTHDLLSSDNEDDRRGGEHFRFEKGRRVYLEVIVEDVDLFQIVSSSIWVKTPIGIPGARISVIHHKEPGQYYVIDWLQKQLKALVDNPPPPPDETGGE